MIVDRDHVVLQQLDVFAAFQVGAFAFGVFDRQRGIVVENLIHAVVGEPVAQLLDQSERVEQVFQNQGELAFGKQGDDGGEFGKPSRIGGDFGHLKSL